MKTAVNYFSKAMDILERVLRLIIGLSMLVMLVVIAYQVILRYIFKASNIWSEELARYLMCYVVLLGAAIATRKYAHLQVDFLINMENKRYWDGGTLEVRASVENGRFTRISFWGDFMSRCPMDELTEALRGCLFRKAEVTAVLDRYPLTNYFGTITKDDIQ